MNFQPIPCHESLRPFIRNYWMLTAQCTATGTQQIFSNGAASLQFYLESPVRLSLPSASSANDPDTDERLYRAVLFQQEMQTVGVTCEKGDFNVFGAEFVPFCSRVFFRSQPEGPFASPEDLCDEELAALSQRIDEAATIEERVKLLDDFMLKRLAEFPEGDVNMERLGDVFDEVVPTDGKVARPPHCQDEFSPADLASTACLSQKQFTRVFNKYVGMNPKAYLRLLRFHKALQKLRAVQSTPAEKAGGPKAIGLRDIAAECGYYDLPHMTADFRDICGCSPSELISSGAELTEAFGQQFSGLMKKKIKIENLI